VSEKCIEICKAENGYTIEVCMPLTMGATQTAMMACCCQTAEKQYVAKDAAEVSDLIEDILPLLDQDFKTEDDFDKAFDKAVNDIEAVEAA
jgi:hypothetical protein